VTRDERPWSSTASARTQRDFSLEEIRVLDANAVRICDGFEFRYHRGGLVTWFALSTGHGLPIAVLVGVPEDYWRHLKGCSCRECMRSAVRQRPATAGRDGP
jgi:hypothetical protein